LLLLLLLLLQGGGLAGRQQLRRVLARLGRRALALLAACSWRPVLLLLLRTLSRSRPLQLLLLCCVCLLLLVLQPVVAAQGAAATSTSHTARSQVLSTPLAAAQWLAARRKTSVQSPPASLRACQPPPLPTQVHPPLDGLVRLPRPPRLAQRAPALVHHLAAHSKLRVAEHACVC
jgi:hypothetical protein